MKKIIGTVIGYYLTCFILAVLIYSFLFPYGGVAGTLHRIYFGLIVLSAIIVICTCIILEEIQNLKEELMKIKDDSDEETPNDLSK